MQHTSTDHQRAIVETVHTLRQEGQQEVTVAQVWCRLPLSFDDIWAAIEASNLEIQVNTYGVITCCGEMAM